MTDTDRPILEREASAASNAAQASYWGMMIAQLALLVAIQLASVWSPCSDAGRRVVAAIISLCTLGAFAVTMLIRLKKPDDKWFRCRALSENLKSAMWRFVMSPAHEPAPDMNERRFLKEVEQIRARHLAIASEVVLQNAGSGTLITPWMRELRTKSLQERLGVYREHRLENQIEWYRNRGRFNARHERLWFNVIMGAELAVLVLAGLQWWLLWPLNMSGGVAALAGAWLTWTQARRHSDLANTYSVAADDLRLVEPQAAHVVTERQLERLVDQVEAAVSREHSMWIARRVT